MLIRDGVHSGWCTFGVVPIRVVFIRVVSIRDGVHLGLSIRGGVYLGWCPFGQMSIRIVFIRDRVHSGSSPFRIVSICDGDVHRDGARSDCAHSDCVHSDLCLFWIVPIRDGAHSEWCPFGMVSIRNGVHSEWCPFGMVSIRDGVHSGWRPFGMVPFGMVSIRHGAHSGWCPFGMVSIRHGVHSGWCPFGMVSIRDGVLWDCVFRDCVHLDNCSRYRYSQYLLVRQQGKTNYNKKQAFFLQFNKIKTNSNLE